MVTVEMKLTTGIILVSGSNFQSWIDRTFKPWKSLAVDGILEPVKVPPNIHAPAAKTEVNTELERLWEEHGTLKNALTTLDKSVSSLSDDVKTLHSTITH